MLARASSDAGTRLRRSKSTSSNVHRPLPPGLCYQDPDVAQQYALAAAATAFVRAHDTGASECQQRRSGDISRTRSNTSRKSLLSQGSHFSAREPSSRSLQQSKGGPMSSTSRQSRASTVATEQFPPFHPTPSTNRPLSAQPSITLNENSRPSTQPKPSRASASSSITSQQIRKARSMYYASSVQTGSPVARPPAKYLTTPPPTTTSSSLGTVPTLSSSRMATRSPPASPRLPVTLAPDETVEKARDKYLQSFRERQVKHKPSIFLAPFRKRQDKAKESEPPAPDVIHIYSGCQQLSADPVHDTNLNDFQPPKDKKERRSFSNSLKNKFKKVFRRSSNSSTTMPVQQIQASRDYFSQFPQQTQNTDQYLNVPSPDDATLQRIRSRTPPFDPELPTPPRPGSSGSNRSLQSLRSNRSNRSNRSLHSEAHSNAPAGSRVTSWGTSSAGGTLTQRDIKRLTVIHEAKDSIGSETERLAGAALPHYHTAPFQQQTHILKDAISLPPSPGQDLSDDITGTTQYTRHPQASSSQLYVAEGEGDVFTSNIPKEPQHPAFSKEQLPRSSADGRSCINNDRRSPSKDLPANPLDLRRSSSIRSFGKAFRSTIRAVTSSEQPCSHIPERTTSVRGVVRIPRPDTAASSVASDSESRENEDDNNELDIINFKMGKIRQPTARDQDIPEVTTPSAEQIKQRVHKSLNRWKTPLEETKIPDFMPPTERRFAVTSFVKRTFSRRQSEEGPNVRLPDDKPFSSPNQPAPNEVLVSNLQSLATPISPRRKLVLSPTTPSVYSRNTDGVSLPPNDSSVSLNAKTNDKPHETGSALIVTSQSIKSYVIGTPSPRRGHESSRSSKDWKAWLAHEVSELASLPQEDITIKSQYNSLAKHHRELAQIEDEDATIRFRKSTEFPNIQTQEDQDVCDRAVNNHGSSSEIYADNSTPTTAASMKVVNEAKLLQPSFKNSISIDKRTPSALSQYSTSSRVDLDNPTSARMNGRFPYIDTSRRSSSRQSKWVENSQSPTYRRSSSCLKDRSSSKPSLSFAIGSSKRSENIQLTAKEMQPDEYKKDNLKENTMPVSGACKSSTSLAADPASSYSISRPKSLQTLSTTFINRSPSNLARYTTSADEHLRSVIPRPSRDRLSRTRIRAHVSPNHQARLYVRPKSAYNLRDSVSSPTTPTSAHLAPRPSYNSSKQPAGYTQKSLDQKPVSVRSSLEGLDSHILPLHMQYSSSSLALNKEPKSNPEDQDNDSMTDADMYGSSRGGSVTPGQRMVDKFLRERSTGSPASIFRREETPAFL